MERINQIMEHPVYQYKQQRIEELEENRLFCKHGLEHALDVARILYIQVLEKGLPYPKDVVYATALLHDLGRCDQYENHIEHHEASVRIAELVLKECSFSDVEIVQITGAIRAHQKTNIMEGNSLNELLYLADKLSRKCYQCQVKEECYWEEDKKNKRLFY